MGKAALSPTEEDTLLCRIYKKPFIRRKLSLQQKLCALRHLEGERFFNPQNQIQCPQRDFYLATTPNQFDFVLRAVPYERDFHSIQK